MHRPTPSQLVRQSISSALENYGKLCKYWSQSLAEHFESEKRSATIIVLTKIIKTMKNHKKNHQKSSSIIKNHDKSSNIMKNHQKSSNIMKNHQKSSQIHQHHQKSSNIIKNHQTSSIIIKNHEKS